MGPAVPLFFSSQLNYVVEDLKSRRGDGVGVGVGVVHLMEQCKCHNLWYNSLMW